MALPSGRSAASDEANEAAPPRRCLPPSRAAPASLAMHETCLRASCAANASSTSYASGRPVRAPPERRWGRDQVRPATADPPLTPARALSRAAVSAHGAAQRRRRGRRTDEPRRAARARAAAGAALCWRARRRSRRVHLHSPARCGGGAGGAAVRVVGAHPHGACARTPRAARTPAHLHACDKPSHVRVRACRRPRAMRLPARRTPLRRRCALRWAAWYGAWISRWCSYRLWRAAPCQHPSRRRFTPRCAACRAARPRCASAARRWPAPKAAREGHPLTQRTP